VVLAPWVNLCGVEVERQNEALAALAGDRVVVLGTVDLEAPEQLVDLMRDGRLAGVEIPASPGGAYLGDERFREFWAAAAEAGALVFVHPSTRGFALPVMDEHYLWNTVGNPVETTVTAAHMVGAGVLDDFPDLRVLLAHGGGVLPALRGRLAHEQTVHEPGRDVRAAIGRFYVDTVVHDLDVLRGLVDFFGAERVLLGSDYPFDMGVERPAEIVRALGLPPEDEAAILGRNALRLLRQESPA
jgi:aminocarboxymuconate-semialdehyde decarboxylase